MKQFFLFSCTLMMLYITKAQSTGDYRSFTSGSWNIAATWERFNGTSWINPAPAAPSSTDGIITIRNGHTVTVNSGVTTDQTVVEAGGILTLTSTLTVANSSGDDITVNGTFNLNSGTLNGPGLMIVSGGMEWQNAQIDGNVVLLAGAVSSKTGTGTGAQLRAGGVLTNNGTFNWTNGNIRFLTGTFNNGSTGIINALGDHVFTNEGTNAFNNAGTFNKTGGTGNTAISVGGSNSGTINVNAGTISSGAAFTNTGTINIASGRTFLVNSGTFVLSTGSSVDGAGRFQLLSGTVTVNALVTATNVLLSNGIMNGAGTLSVIVGLEWQNTQIHGNVELQLGATSSKTGTGTEAQLRAGGVLTNNGTFNWTNGNIRFLTGTFNNGSSGIINALGDHEFTNEGTNAFNNAGTFNKTGGTGITAISVGGSNSGIINVNSGTIRSGGNMVNSGTINITSGNTFEVNSNTFSFNTGSLSTGAGTFRQSNGVIIVNAPAATPATATNILLGGGVLQGTGTLTVSGGMEWQNTQIHGNVELLASAVSSKTGTGSEAQLRAGGVLTNNGTFNWTDGNIRFLTGTFNNGTTGIINALGDHVFTNEGTDAFNNAGTLIKSNTGTTMIGITSSNTGTIKGIGTFNFSSSFISNGIIAPGTSPGILTFNGAQPLSANSTLQIEIMDGSGAGTGHDQLVRAGNMTLAGTLTVMQTGPVPLGTYTIINLTSGTLSGSFNTVNLPAGYTMQVNSTTVTVTQTVLLPLKLISFTGNVKAADAQLQWRTANEVNLSRFEVQRSLDGRNFSTIGTLQVGSSNYSFTDPAIFNNAAVAYYQLKSIDNDGKFTSSAIIRLSNQRSIAVGIFPNPATDFITISGLSQKGIIKLFSVDGKLLLEKTVTAQSMTLDVTKYIKGSYLLQYQYEGKVSNQTIIRQ